MKFCKKCNKDKNDDDFHKGQVWCKICHAEYKKQWEIDNKEHVKSTKRLNDIKNQDHNREYYREYKIKNKEAVAQNRRRYVNEKRKNDPVYRINQTIANTINGALKSVGGSKNGESKSKYLPYTMKELKEHLESQFESWMNWENHGIYVPETWNETDQNTWTWNIDHKTARAELPYASMQDENFKKCWALENLRPLSSKINLAEGQNIRRKIKK